MKILTTLLTISIFIASGFSEDKKEIQKIEISAAGNPPGTMKFTKSEFKAKVGKIELNFKKVCHGYNTLQSPYTTTTTTESTTTPSTTTTTTTMMTTTATTTTSTKTKSTFIA